MAELCRFFGGWSLDQAESLRYYEWIVFRALTPPGGDPDPEG